MSYDLWMMAPGADPEETLESSEPVDASTRRLAEALRPGYELSEGSDAIVLTGDPVQIWLSPRSATITFPYWSSLDPAQLAAEVDRVSKVIGAQTGWELFDPQLDRVLDPVADFDAFAAKFAQGVAVVRDTEG